MNWLDIAIGVLLGRGIWDVGAHYIRKAREPKITNTGDHIRVTGNLSRKDAEAIKERWLREHGGR